MATITKIEKKMPSLPRLLRVAAYARVSKDTEQLMHSLSAQVSYYSALIQRTPGWEYAGVYVDAGITGTSADRRPEFQRMIQDAEAGKIQIILTKSISRFARNTVDLLRTVRRLKEMGVEVRFEKERINTLTADGEVMLSILASFAEQESVSLSNNIKWTFQKKFKNGEVHSHHPTLGYRWEGDKMMVVDDEAEIVQFIYSLYLSGLSSNGIAKELDRKGIKGMHGKQFSASSVRLVLRNEAYTGCMIMQRQFNVSPKKEKVNRGELPMYRIDGHHESIISQETFDLVQAERARRLQETIKKKDGFTSLFTGMVWCGKCGAKASWHRSPQSRKRGDNSSMIWICCKKNRNGSCDCKNTQDRDIRRAAENVLQCSSETELTENLRRVEQVLLFDEKIVFAMKRGKNVTIMKEEIGGGRSNGKCQNYTGHN